LAAAYPKRAKPGTPFGHVVLDCHFTSAGDLTGCSTDTEEPRGQGFADAARSLAPDFHMDPAAATGVDLKRIHIKLAIHFAAPDRREDRRVIDQPDWISADPPAEDVFPQKAAHAGVTTGRAVLDCKATGGGKMSSCLVVSEDPAGMDFGVAAIKTAEAMTINPWTTSGEPAEGAHVVFAVRVNRNEPEQASR
jgi:hypothetical protein